MALIMMSVSLKGARRYDCCVASGQQQLILPSCSKEDHTCLSADHSHHRSNVMNLNDLCTGFELRDTCTCAAECYLQAIELSYDEQRNNRRRSPEWNEKLTVREAHVLSYNSKADKKRMGDGRCRSHRQSCSKYSVFGKQKRILRPASCLGMTPVFTTSPQSAQSQNILPQLERKALEPKPTFP
ncbi:hypothetical protein BJ165DRAFT_231057 [Panaeolus papilionaceus]|nr:hypothetical protein BJ165DRAFT_231057 [Panaeolus papilionaceus]